MADLDTSIFTGAQYAANLPAAPVVGDLVYHAFRIANIVEVAQRGFSAEQFADALWELNMLIDEWKAQRDMVPAIVRTVFKINVGQGGPDNPYYVGQALTPTGAQPDIQIERPERIEWASYLFTNSSPNIEQAFQMLTAQQWASLQPKNLQSGNPTMLYYQPAWPNGLVYLYPIPTLTYVTQGALYTWQTVQAFITALDPVITPPAYVNALTYNLAVRLAARYAKRANLSPWSAAQASHCLSVIKSLNTPVYMMQCEQGALSATQRRGGNWNILSNDYVP